MKKTRIIGYFILALIGAQITLVLFAPQYAYDFRHVDEAKAWIGGYQDEYYECEAFREWRESQSNVDLALVALATAFSEDGEEDLAEFERLMEQCYD